MNLKEIYLTLLNYFGAQNWWPTDKDYHLKRKTNPFDEIVIGAILTQNTSWQNVERALQRLKTEGELSLKFVEQAPLERLKELIKPAGFYNQKAKYLKEIAKFIKNLKGAPPKREELLKVKGIGRETADVILLYAYGVPTFVVDKYTLRWLERYFGIKTDYEGAKKLFESALPPSVPVYREFHALIDELAKQHCRAKNPDCAACPLKEGCLYYKKQNAASRKNTKGGK